MDWMEAIQKSIEYIEEHLLEDINYEDVANYVYISSYEFHRTFSFLLGMSPNTYIRNRRLSKAGIEVKQSDCSITELAFKYGYETPESFTKAFTRFHGISPKNARNKEAKLVLFNPIRIKITVEGGKSMDYRIVETKKQKLIALVRSFSNEIISDENDHSIPDFWDECIDHHLLDPMKELRVEGKKDLYGLCTPTSKETNSFDYGIGVLVDEDTKEFDLDEYIKQGYTIWDIEAGAYVVFDCIGKDGNCISEMWSKFYQEFLPQMGYVASQRTDYELYYENQKDDLFCELWIPIDKRI